MTAAAEKGSFEDLFSIFFSPGRRKEPLAIFKIE